MTACQGGKFRTVGVRGYYEIEYERIADLVEFLSIRTINLSPVFGPPQKFNFSVVLPNMRQKLL